MTAQPVADSQVDLSTIPISPAGTNSQDENKNPNGGEEQITVFHDKDNFNVKHPLMNKWTLWFTKPPSGKVSTNRQFNVEHLLTLQLGRQLERSVEGGYHFQLCRGILGCLRMFQSIDI
jgi:hypothetical protein